MTLAPRRWAADLLHVWFEQLGPGDWFGGPSAQVDTMLAQRFGRVLEALGLQPATTFLTDPKLARAAILLFDQVPRNIYRGSARAYTFDPLAIALCRGAIARGWDRGLSDAKRQFVGMPLMHSERIADQRASLAWFARHLPQNLPFARSHHVMIARFGRFPHRNAVLGRTSTPAEKQALRDGFNW